MEFYTGSGKYFRGLDSRDSGMQSWGNPLKTPLVIRWILFGRIRIRNHLRYAVADLMETPLFLFWEGFWEEKGQPLI